MLWRPAYVGLGSNLDEPAMQIQRALSAMAQLPRTQLRVRSSLYGSRPMGPVPQPDYVNAAAGLLTQLEATELFGELRRLERDLGRIRTAQRWGARRIDLDLLLYGQLRLAGPELQLPHPGLTLRNFVLYPLNELAPQLQVPGCARIAELAARVSPEGIWRLPCDSHPL
ncbi:MAG: 2-amino-4-hydroxy-6-hydroxymethyldihydropteridine diphosphokinase [Steroidobacteraceae bacterium]|jgi:2-amino-4-hydroxy-6-hydroxymethyldihydropteridine diphosphokinase